jgi:hypothetical protein
LGPAKLSRLCKYPKDCNLPARLNHLDFIGTDY